MSKRTKVLLIVLAVLVVAAGVLWFLTKDKGVSADVNGSTDEKSSDEFMDDSIVKIDDGVTLINAGQTLSFSMVIDTLKLFENVSGIENPNESQFNAWMAQNQYDKYYLNAFLGSGNSSDNGGWIVSSPNFSIKLPELKFPLVEIKYSASANAPANISLTGNKVKNIARIVRRPCYTENRLLGGHVLRCPIGAKTRVAQHIDVDTISFDANRTDLALSSFTVNDNDMLTGEEVRFVAEYRNTSTSIAGGSKFKVRFKEGSLTINDPAFKKAASETIEGVKYDVYIMTLGNVMPTVNGTSRTDAATIASIKSSLQAALVGNSNTEVIRVINGAVMVVDQYAAGTKTITELTNAVNGVKTAVDNVNDRVLGVDDSNINTIINWLTIMSNYERNQAEERSVILQTLETANQYKLGNKTRPELATSIEALAKYSGNASVTTYLDSLRIRVGQLSERHLNRGFGTGTMTAVYQAVSSCTSLSANANTPAPSIRIPFTATAAMQVVGTHRIEVFAELTTTSNDSEPANNKKSIPLAIIVPSS